MLSHHRQLICVTWLVLATTMTSCTEEQPRVEDMLVTQKDAIRQADLGRDLKMDTAGDITADTGSDSTTNEEDAASNTGCPLPADLPSMYACVEVEGIGIQLLKIQHTSDGHSFYAKTSGSTPGWDQLVITVNLEAVGNYVCQVNFTEIEFTTKVATMSEIEWVANSANQNCQVDVTKAAIKAGEVYEGTFGTEAPKAMSGSFKGLHN